MGHCQEEYLSDLVARNCTVEAGRTNVGSHTRLIFACGDWLQRLSWLDGMPLVFSLPLEHSPAPGDFLVRLSDGTEVETFNHFDINILVQESSDRWSVMDLMCEREPS